MMNDTMEVAIRSVTLRGWGRSRHEFSNEVYMELALLNPGESDAVDEQQLIASHGLCVDGWLAVATVEKKGLLIVFFRLNCPSAC